MIRKSCTGIHQRMSSLFRRLTSSTHVHTRVGQCTGVAATVAATPHRLTRLCPSSSRRTGEGALANSFESQAPAPGHSAERSKVAVFESKRRWALMRGASRVAHVIDLETVPSWGLLPPH